MSDEINDALKNWGKPADNPGGSPLDGAISEVKRRREPPKPSKPAIDFTPKSRVGMFQQTDERRKQGVAQRESEAQAFKREFVALVSDFLERVGRRQNRGTEEIRIRKSRRNPFEEKVQAWLLVYETGDFRGALQLTVDGRTVCKDNARKWSDAWVDYRRGDTLMDTGNPIWNRKRLDRLALSMAELLDA